jgi:PAB-dependent poly(A)-specific ribonuclease subunit 3
VFGLPSSIYKAIRSLDGKQYCLRRIENYRIGNEQAIGVIEAWAKIRHSGIVSVQEGFTTKAFGDTCLLIFIVALVVVYDYQPLAVSLHAKHFAKSESIIFHGINPDILISYICQLTAAISVVHGKQLAVRVLDSSKILLTGKNRYEIIKMKNTD